MAHEERKLERLAEGDEERVNLDYVLSRGNKPVRPRGSDRPWFHSRSATSYRI